MFPLPVPHSLKESNNFWENFRLGKLRLERPSPRSLKSGLILPEKNWRKGFRLSLEVFVDFWDKSRLDSGTEPSFQGAAKWLSGENRTRSFTLEGRWTGRQWKEGTQERLLAHVTVYKKDPRMGSSLSLAYWDHRLQKLGKHVLNSASTTAGYVTRIRDFSFSISVSCTMQKLCYEYLLHGFWTQKPLWSRQIQKSGRRGLESTFNSVGRWSSDCALYLLAS